MKLLKDVIRKLREIGLQVVATVCDQGPTNVAAVNNLLEETRASFLRNHIENRFHGYLIDNEEVVHLYDGPHLIKGVRNSLLNKTLYVQKVASWEHVVQMYAADKRMGQFSQFIKLTDEHVIPNRIKT